VCVEVFEMFSVELRNHVVPFPCWKEAGVEVGYLVYKRSVDVNITGAVLLVRKGYVEI